MKNFINSNLFYYIRTNMQGQYSYVNEHFKKKFGFITNNFIGRFTSDAIHPDDFYKCKEAVYFCLQNPTKKQIIEIRKPNSDGTYFYSTWEFSLYQNSDLKETEIQCIGFDVTDKQLQLQSVIDNLPDLVYIINKNGLIVDVFVPSLIKYENIIAQNKNKSIFEVSCFKNIIFEDILTYLDKNGSLKNKQYHAEIENQTFWYNANITAFRYNNQDCILWVARDITEIVENQKKLLHQDKALTDIARINSHNLRSPVARILGLCNILENDKLSIHNSEIIKYIKETALLLDVEIKKVSKLSS